VIAGFTLKKEAPDAKRPCRNGMAFCVEIIAGDHLISHTVSRAVPSAQRGLTSVFGMGTGDPSQYGHRQIVRGNEILRSRSGFRLKAHTLKRLNLAGAWRVVARSNRSV
jgi:hypothetical protein